MRLGIFSDVHDNVPNLNKTKQVFIKEKINMALFCGDLTSPFTLKFVEDWPWVVKAVFGNNEGDKWGIVRRFSKYDLKHWEYPKSGIMWDLKIDGLKIATFHGNCQEITDSLINYQKYDLICTGHTHRASIVQHKKTLWINPGSVVGISEYPDIKIASVAIFNTKTKKVKIIELK